MSKKKIEIIDLLIEQSEIIKSLTQQIGLLVGEVKSIHRLLTPIKEPGVRKVLTPEIQKKVLTPEQVVDKMQDGEACVEFEKKFKLPAKGLPVEYIRQALINKIKATTNTANTTNTTNTADTTTTNTTNTADTTTTNTTTTKVFTCKQCKFQPNCKKIANGLVDTCYHLKKAKTAQKPATITTTPQKPALSGRQLEVYNMLKEGMSQVDIEEVLGVTVHGTMYILKKKGYTW